MTTMIIIGLGNPDEKYQNTRHNIGFMFIDYLAKQNDFSAKSPSGHLGGPASGWELNKKLNALIAKGKIDKASVVLAKPLSYVNKTGEVASKLKNFYKTKPENFIIAQDDLDIDFGNFKLSFDKNSGGHKGVESVIKALKTKKFHRVRFGISSVGLKKVRQQSDKIRDNFVMDFVLSKFGKKEDETLKTIFKSASERLSEILS